MNFYERNSPGRFAFLKILSNLALRLSRINLSEISLSYQKSRWLKKSISFELYCVDIMFIDLQWALKHKGFSNTSELSVPIFH